MRRENVVFTVFLGLLALGAGVVAFDFRPLARIFPLSVAVGILAFSVLHLVLLAATGERPAEPDEREPPPLTAVLPYVLWLAGYLAVIWLTGFITATALLVAGFLHFVARLRWLITLASAGAAVALVLVLGRALHIFWPKGWLWTLGG